MTDHLRTIVVSVEESEHGRLHWLLIESIDDPTGFTVLLAARRYSAVGRTRSTVGSQP